MRSSFRSWAGLALVSLFLLLGGSLSPPASAQALTASLTTNRGCGAAAVYNIGEPISFLFSVSVDASVTLRLQRPDGTVSTLLASQFLRGGATYSIAGIIGNPPGQRLLTLDAAAGTQTAHMECTYSAPSAPSTLTATLQTDRSCGANAVYNPGEPILFTFSVSQTAQVTLTLVRPDGSTSTLVPNQLVPGGVPQSIQGIIGSLTGQRRLILDAVAGGQPAHVECTYTVPGTPTGGPVSLSLSVDMGCGASYHVGQLITALYSASANTAVTLVDQHANGTVSTIFANQPVLAGQTYSILGVIGTDVGGRTLTLTASSGTTSPPATCQFTVVP